MVSRFKRAAWVAAFACALPVAHASQGEQWQAGPAPMAAEEPSYPPEAMFEFLVAEVAGQRGDFDSAFAIYQRLARELRDPHVARRAVELAVRMRAFGPAMQSAALLIELDPDSALGREIIAATLATERDIAKARVALSGLIEKSSARAALLMQLSHFFSKYPDKAKVLEQVRLLAAQHADMPQSHYATGVAALIANQLEEAAREADQALASRPAWDQGAILKAQVLRKSAPKEVVPFYEAFVAQHPGSVEARMQLGRELAGERKLVEAREQFRASEKLASRDPQPPYAVGLLSLQLEDFAEAASAFGRALKLGYRESAAIYFGMGQAAEGLKRYDEAIGWYQKVEAGDWVRAQLKIASLISRQQGLEAGREYLRRIEPRSGEDRVQMIQVEAQLLREAKAWRETYDMLSKAVAAHPDSFELLYDRAMAAERVDKIDVLEADLRQVIKMKPDYAHAYNALGYTLADRTTRLEEARDLIEKAHKLAPEDPFILDSLGWVHYRLGNNAEALKHLNVAYSTRPDPEIAAHLGEVLWKSGQRDEAQKIWRTALSENPNHETLLAVIQKYRP
ncbi:MAG TPA: tetratricopeptide repeat protein [Usitatibacter sp.]|nr:tetratricopeptide repeat protein [Usitatibacter sp.]